MNVDKDIFSIQLLNELCDDLRGLKSATRQAFRKQLQDFHAPPDRAQEARQTGVEEGLALACEVLTKRLIYETSKHGCTTDAGAARTFTELKLAQAEYDLSVHGALAPLASATYSAYAQAHRRLQQARGAHARYASSHAAPIDDELS